MTFAPGMPVLAGDGSTSARGGATRGACAVHALRATAGPTPERRTASIRQPPDLAQATFTHGGAPQCFVASDCVEAGVRTGGCLCGAVRYSVRGDPVHVRRCHCADCRKESGSAFTVYAQWPVEAFEMSGEISSYDGRGFCPRCGSRLLDTADPGDTLIEIRIGSLDEAPFELKPQSEIWVKRRESWIPAVEGAAQHAES
jgi:hypothetical protein